MKKKQNCSELELYKKRLLPYSCKFKKEDGNIENIIKKNFGDYWIISPTYSYGEVFITASLMKQFKKTKNGKILFIVKDKKIADLILRFKSVDKVIIASQIYIEIKHLLENNEKNMKKGKIFAITNRYPPKKNYFENALDLHKNFLNLPANAALEKIKIEDSLIKKMKAKYDINDKTIFLSPYANSLNYKILPKSFWIKLADAATAGGFNVIINSNTREYKKYNCVFESILNTVAISEGCCFNVAFRSGLIDILAGTVTGKIFVIYPSDVHQIHRMIPNNLMAEYIKNTYRYDKRKPLSKNILNILSLKKIYSNNNITEILYDNDEKALTEKIFKHITD